MGKIVAICTSDKKGMRKKDQGEGLLEREFGLAGDAHASDEWHRQVSLLAIESIDKMRGKGLNVNPGDFAENITTEGLTLFELPIGTRLRLGEEAIGEVSQIGKECHNRCAIYEQAGDCVMPREGIFIRVLRGGQIKNGDPIEIDNKIITVGIITASDKGSKGEREDISGPTIKDIIAKIGGIVLEYKVLSDDKEQLAEAMRSFADQKKLDLIFTTGGTGFSPRDNTPEATLAVIERQVPGLPEAMRAAGMANNPKAMLSRATAGIRGQSLIINLPGSVRGVRENLEVLLPALPHGVEILRGIGGECGHQ